LSGIAFQDPRMAAGATPIIGDLPAGPSLRYDPEFEAIEAEVRRVESEGPNAVRWQQVAPDAIAFLQNRSKDLLVAAYGCFALWRQEGVRGAAVGLTIIDGMIEAHWAGLTPPRERARVAALEWVVGRLAPAMESLTPPPGDAAPLEAAYEALRRIEERLGALLQKEQVALGDLLRPLRRHAEEFRRIAAEERRKREAEAAAAEARRVAAEAAAVEAARLAEQQALEAEARAAAAQEEAAAQERETGAALATLGGAGAGTPEAQLAAVAAALLTLSRHRLAQGDRGFETNLLVASAALLRLSALRRDAGRAVLPAPPDTIPADASAAASQLGTAPHSLSAWRLLDAEAVEPAAALPLRAAIRTLLALEPDLVRAIGADGMPLTDDATQAWLDSEVAPPVSLETPLSTARTQAQALLASGQAERALAILAVGGRGAPAGREKFSWQLAQAEIALAAEMPSLALPLLRHLDVEAQRHSLDQWEPDLAAAMLALQCRALAAPSAAGLINADLRKSSYADAHDRLCRVDIALAQLVRQEASLS
jgi:type VI secretion system protein VasJ